MNRGQYASAFLKRDVMLTLHAVARRMPSEFAFSGLTAAWLLGLDVEPSEPVEVTIDREVPVRARAGVKLRRAALDESDVTIRNGFRMTSPMRTVRDLGSRSDVVEAVVAIEMAIRAGIVTMQQLSQYVATHPGEKGIRRLRRATAHSDPRAESPMETRLRMALVKGRLPTPCVQVNLKDASGAFVGRVDLYYPDRRLAIEYDGDIHRERLVSDLRRQNALLNAGYRLLRFTATDLRTPASVVAQVRHARALAPRTHVSPDEAA